MSVHSTLAYEEIHQIITNDERSAGNTTASRRQQDIKNGAQRNGQF